MAEPRAPKYIFEALTYDDMLLLPAYSEVLSRDCDTGTRLTPTIWLYLPLIAVAMNTVTESDMAITLAQESGLGILFNDIHYRTTHSVEGRNLPSPAVGGRRWGQPLPPTGYRARLLRGSGH